NRIGWRMTTDRPSSGALARRGAILTLGFVGFVTAFGAHIVAVNLPVYAEHVGVGIAVIGLLIAVYDLAEIVARPLFGLLADRRWLKATLLSRIPRFLPPSLPLPL